MIRKYLVLLLIGFFFVTNSIAQTKLSTGNSQRPDNPFGEDTSAVRRAKGFKNVATIDMYLQYNKELDTSLVDTTLIIDKYYKFNYLQKDNFGLMPFANIGQAYNTLTFNQRSTSALPLFGARARHFNYFEVKDIKYFEVPTPWTRLTYKTAFQQGQLLDAFLTVNLSKQFNFSIAYKGLRSLGNYQNALTSTGNFRFTSNYKSKNDRYRSYGHIVMQDLLNQENGGLRDEDLVNFESGNEEFIDRSVFDPNFENAENILVGKRFHLEHAYDLIRKKDSLDSNVLSLTNTISFEDKFYDYTQQTAVAGYFGDSFSNQIKDKVTIEHFYTELGFVYQNDLLGQLDFNLGFTDINYGYDSVVLTASELIPNRIKANFLSANTGYSKQIGQFLLKGSAGINLSEEFSGNFIDANLSININEDINLGGGLNISSRLPNYNFLLYQSDYINYNWYNLEKFNNVNSQQFSFRLKSEKYLNASLDLTNIDNYTYFNLENVVDKVRVVKPVQFSGSLQYLRLKLRREIKFGKFALDNTIMYQNVVSDEDVLNVPNLITRNTLYYSNEIFNRAMKLQTGVSFNYFTKYNMNGYDPLLAEFYTQNQTEYGGFPRLDFFVNAKVRQTRIFFIAEHFNSSFTGFNFYSAPNHPFRDFTIRFGLVWDFFL
ncbi:putative porin [Winogradskyella alexanderae]|uniref:Porin n=1 Tax=Winogradskyella alexanderae TaxID=2877123 RepID=A0ABS7XT97_9FLAO|nr:putative porin [Winogradskyella alexanderae]MCA0133243.1 putative porin [Winogradskyella alexanderae]